MVTDIENVGHWRSRCMFLIRLFSDMGSCGTVSNTAQWDIDFIWKCNACLRRCCSSCRVFQEPLATLQVASILWSVLQHPDGYSGQPRWCLPGVDTWTASHSQAQAMSAQTQKPRFLWTTLLMTKLNSEHTANTHTLCTCVQKYVSFAPRKWKSS